MDTDPEGVADGGQRLAGIPENSDARAFSLVRESTA
jgi:hypothetical protein